MAKTKCEMSFVVSHLLTSEVIFRIYPSLSLILITKNDMKLRMQAPLAGCHDSCYHWSWCNSLQIELLQQIVTVIKYSKKKKVQSNNSRPAGLWSCKFSLTAWWLLHWLVLQFDTVDTQHYRYYSRYNRYILFCAAFQQKLKPFSQSKGLSHAC